MFYALLALIPLAPPSRADAPSVHGMLLFGSNKVYVSHLPMFHPPHDYQLIAEITLPADAAATYRRSLAAHPEETVYTLVPERLALPDLVAHPRPFRADLYRGHFERGGSVIAASVTVNLARVLVWRKFVPSAEKPAAASFVLFGNPAEAFVAHLIVAPPDFDQVIEAGAGAPVRDGEAVTLKGLTAGPLAPPGWVFLQGPDGADTELKLQRQLYLEKGDLEE